MRRAVRRGDHMQRYVLGKVPPDLRAEKQGESWKATLDLGSFFFICFCFIFSESQCADIFCTSAFFSASFAF